MVATHLDRFAGQTSEVLGAILAQSLDCIKLINLDGEIEYVNPNGLKALGVGDFSELVGKRWPELWPAETRERISSALDLAARGQTDRFDGYCPDASGNPRWWDVSVSPILQEDGKVSHVLATSRDITERVQERLQGEMLQKRAQDKADRSDTVAREMRHRLKNQLAVVGSVASLLARNSSDAGELVQKLAGKLQALARAQDLLTIHHAEPPLVGVAVAQVLEASGAGERIEVGTMPDGRLGDDAIQQLALILGELQTNSLKYGALANDGGHITLTGTRSGRDLALHWHEDTGQAMEKPESEGAGFKLLTRLGSTSNLRASVQWHSRGPTIDFYVRALD